MNPIERIYKFLKINKLRPFTFEQKCGLSNAYLSKQRKGEGVIGSEMLVRILNGYPELSIIWILTGQGNMIIAPTIEAQIQEQDNLVKGAEAKDSSPGASPGASPEMKNAEIDGMGGIIKERLKSNEDLIKLLREQNATLTESNASKDKIIALLEAQIPRGKTKVK